MSKENLSTNSYKGVRDFYPEDMAIQRYIFDTWAKSAESFGFERYDASILEPSELYRSKGAVNEEMVNEQTYTFIDRGEREVTLRPEMTPTVARMVAGKQRELRFPLRWYSIPNLFRYERPQRGRLREHWQLNCDIFGEDDISADVEIIILAYNVLKAFQAKDDTFEIRINSRSFMNEWYSMQGISDVRIQNQLTNLNDRMNKISKDEYSAELSKILYGVSVTEGLEEGLRSSDVKQLRPEAPLRKIIETLSEVGITNVKFDKMLARGFDYYTGTIFEIFEVDKDGNSTGRSLLGGGRYDNLTSMFSDQPISGIGFGMGDVTMRDFLDTHKLIPTSVHTTAPKLVMIPTDGKLNLEAQKIAQVIRTSGISVSTDIGTKKIGKKISDAASKGAAYTIVVGTDELSTGRFTLKNLADGSEINETIEKLFPTQIVPN